MDFKTGFLVLTFVLGCFALPRPEDDMSIFFPHADPNARIVGGSQAADGSHPHMAALSSGTMVRSYACGGSVVGRRSVLTAAHCINAMYSFGSLTSSLRVTVGTNRWNSGGTSYRLARNATHPHYIHGRLRNDIGLLITTTDIVLTARVQIVPLTFDFIPEGVSTRVAGWGRIRHGGSISAALLEIQTTTINADECKVLAAQGAIDFDHPNAPTLEPHKEMCTYHSAGVGTCHGDSGSPLVRVNDGAQVGIVSWGFPCARGAPDMYVRISYFQSWLNTHLV